MIKVTIKQKKYNRDTPAVDKDGIGINIASDGIFCRFFDETTPFAEVQPFLNETGSSWGTSQIVLTDADIEKLKSGQMLAWGQEEYATLIYYGEVIDETPKS